MEFTKKDEELIEKVVRDGRLTTTAKATFCFAITRYCYDGFTEEQLVLPVPEDDKSRILELLKATGYIKESDGKYSVIEPSETKGECA